MLDHVFTHRRLNATFKSRLRAIVAGFLFALACGPTRPLAAATNDNVWRRIEVPTGWIVETGIGGAVYVVDKKHTWDGLGQLEEVPGGAKRLRTPTGWIVELPKGGAAYLDDKKAAWKFPPAPTPTPTPLPTPSPVPTPEPTPTPPPVPPISDSAPGVESTIVAQNMARTDGGYFQSVSLGRSGSKSDNECYVQTRLKVAPRPGQTVRVTYRERHNITFKSGQNIKDKRNWSASTYPNEYEALDGSNSNKKVTVEPGDGSVLNFRIGQPWTVSWYTAPVKLGQWQTIIKEITFATGPGAADGRLKITYCDGEGKNCSEVLNRTRWQTDSLKYPGTWSSFGSQMVLANASSSNKFAADSYFEAYAPLVQFLP